MRLLSYEHCQAKTGTPQIRWKAQIEEPADHEGVSIVDHTALTDNAMWRVSNLIAGFGLKFTPNIDTTTPYFDQLCDACKGRTAYWRNEVGKDQNGNDRNNIRGFEVDTEQEVVEFAEEEDATPASVKAQWDN